MTTDLPPGDVKATQWVTLTCFNRSAKFIIRSTVSRLALLQDTGASRSVAMNLTFSGCEKETPGPSLLVLPFHSSITASSVVVRYPLKFSARARRWEVGKEAAVGAGSCNGSARQAEIRAAGQDEIS